MILDETRRRRTGPAFINPRSFFTGGKNGFWYDNDPSTWFEDSAMTIPATFGNPIGAWKDKSGNAIDALQSVSGRRPTYGRMPFGGVRNQLLNTAVMATQSRDVSVFQKTLSFTGAGTITLTGASIAGPLIGTGASDRVSLTFTPSAGTLTMTVVGDVRLAQLENAAAPSAYQQVVLGWDVTESGVASVACPWFDGVDDFLDLTASGAGLVQNVGQFIVTSSCNFTKALSSTEPPFYASINGSTGARFLQSGGATNVSGVQVRRLDADSLAILATAQQDFSNLIQSSVAKYATGAGYIRKNGAQVAQNPTLTSAGLTQNSASSSVYLGRASAAYFGGFLSSIFAIADTALSDAQLLQLETYMAQQIGVTGL